VIEEFELPNGHKFVITEELLTRKTALGKIVREYMEKKNNANSDEEKIEAINNLFLTIFNEINSGNANLSLEFHNQLVKIMSI